MRSRWRFAHQGGGNDLNNEELWFVDLQKKLEISGEKLVGGDFPSVEALWKRNLTLTLSPAIYSGGLAPSVGGGHSPMMEWRKKFRNLSGHDTHGTLEGPVK